MQQLILRWNIEQKPQMKRVKALCGIFFFIFKPNCSVPATFWSYFCSILLSQTRATAKRKEGHDSVRLPGFLERLQQISFNKCRGRGWVRWACRALRRYTYTYTWAHVPQTLERIGCHARSGRLCHGAPLVANCGEGAAIVALGVGRDTICYVFRFQDGNGEKNWEVCSAHEAYNTSVTEAMTD